MARTSSGEYMAAEYITLAQKIINDVDNILRKYPNLMSFEIVPVVTNNQNKSPVLHYEGCLGLEQWCIKQLYTYCYNSIFEKFIFDSKSKYKLTSIIADNVLKLLNVALLINPDVNTFWNVRRDLVVSGSLNLLKELHFTKLVLSRKAKSNETFGYRRWIIEYLLQDDNTQNHFNINRLVAQDMEITENAAQLCPNNYHSWNHRTWFVNKLCSIPNINIIDLHVNEYVRSEKWCSTHISDHSCFHYRQNCIRHICNLNNNSYLSLIEEKLTISYKTILLNFINEYVDLECSENVHFLDEYKLLCSILDSDVDKNSFKNSANSMLMNLYVLFRELLLNNELIIYYKGHETLWYHRRFIIRTILSTLSDYFFSVNTCINQNKRQRKVVCDALVSQTLVFKIIVNHESKYVKERTEDGDNYSERHKKYLKYIEGMVV